MSIVARIYICDECTTALRKSLAEESDVLKSNDLLAAYSALYGAGYERHLCSDNVACYCADHSCHCVDR